MNSKSILYIDIPSHLDDVSFKPLKELSENEYIKMLREYSLSLNDSKNIHSNIYEIDNKQKERTILYSSCPIILYDMFGNLCDINELYKIKKQGMGVLIIEPQTELSDESFESEFKFWLRESMIINNDNTITKDERIQFLPTKNLKLQIDEHIFMLEGTKLYHEYDNMKIAIIIQNIKEL